MEQKSRTAHAFTLSELVVVLSLLLVLGVLALPALARNAGESQRIGCLNNLRRIGLAFRAFATDHQYRLPMNVDIGQGGPPHQTAFSSASQGYGAPHLCEVFGSLSNYLTSPQLLICPSDERTAHSNFLSTLPTTPGGLTNGAISYFLGKDATLDTPQMMLAGDRNLWGNSANQVAPYSTANGGYGNPSSTYQVMGTNFIGTTGFPGWTDKMHRRQGNVLLGDGSVQRLNSAGFRRQCANSGDPSSSWVGLNILLIP